MKPGSGVCRVDGTETFMGELLGELLRLQAVEMELAGMRRTRDSKVRRGDTQRRQVKRTEDKLEANHRAGLELQTRIDALALDVAAREEAINNHRQALNKAKTNKEYAGILAAMNTEKADNTKIETVMLELMTELDDLKAVAAELAEDRDKLNEQVNRSDASVQAYDDETKSERKRLEADRKGFADRLPTPAMNAFRRAAQRHDGEAMGKVFKPRPRTEEYCCAGCNMKITLEIVNSLQNRDEVQMCASCG